eukprot:scaffold153559_cov30-Tisochrysis_lutea.AAC.1
MSDASSSSSSAMLYLPTGSLALVPFGCVGTGVVIGQAEALSARKPLLLEPLGWQPPGRGPHGQSDCTPTCASLKRCSWLAAHSCAGETAREYKSWRRASRSSSVSRRGPEVML